MSQSQKIRLPLPEGDAVPALSERMMRASEQTPDPSSRAQRRAAEYRPDLATAMGELHAAAVRLGELDPQTSELVRLRCATWHNCRVCQSLRHVTGGKRVLDESTAAKVSAYEDSDLDDRQKVALRLADAYMTVPGHIDEELSADVRRDFSDSQVTEMLLDIIAWTQQKPLVALALDIPPDASALTSLDFDEHGEPIIGATLD
jgi:alkylhydroperoxidase family enzyme